MQVWWQVGEIPSIGSRYIVSTPTRLNICNITFGGGGGGVCVCVCGGGGGGGRHKSM